MPKTFIGTITKKSTLEITISDEDLEMVKEEYEGDLNAFLHATFEEYFNGGAIDETVNWLETELKVEDVGEVLKTFKD